MRILTLDGTMTCGHAGVVRLEASQSLVYVDGGPVLVRPDPRGKTISQCPIPTGSGTKTCTKTLPLRTGWSKLVFVDRVPVCREDACGFTDGIPALVIDYYVTHPGQGCLREAE